MIGIVPNLRSKKLDAIRGFAASVVFLMHIITIPSLTLINYEGIDGISKYFWAISLSGYTGVGIFIFLSGYLLTRSLISNQESFIRYITFRWLRVYPIYLIILFFAVTSSGQWDWHGFLNAILLLPNLPGTYWPFPFLATAWSLGIEWTLYFTLYFFVHLKKMGKTIILTTQALFLILMLLAATQGVDKHTIVYGSLIGRIIQFSLGSLFGFWIAEKGGVGMNPWLQRIISKSIPIFIFTYVAWGIFSIEMGGPASNGTWRLLAPYIESLICVLLILNAEFSKQQRGYFVVSIFSFVGKISYPFYLIHLTTLVIINSRMTRLSDFNYWWRLTIFLILSTTFAIFVSWLLHMSIERTINDWKTQRRKQVFKAPT